MTTTSAVTGPNMTVGYGGPPGGQYGTYQRVTTTTSTEGQSRRSNEAVKTATSSNVAVTVVQLTCNSW